MNILHETEDRFHGIDVPGGYEWTYFDGLSDDGEYGFVAIWFRGIPMSPYYSRAIDRFSKRPGSSPPRPKDFCAFSTSVYHKGKRIFSSLHELPAEEFVTDNITPDVRLGKNSLTWSAHPNGTTAYRIGLDTTYPMQMSRVTGEIELQFPPQNIGSIVHDYDPTSTGHFWVPVALGGEFTARLDIWKLGGGLGKYRFSGRAYHDRNFGTAPLQYINASWYWGRCHFGDRTFVFFNIQPGEAGEEALRHCLMLQPGAPGVCTEQVVFGPIQHRKHWATLPYPEVIAGEANEAGLRFNVQTSARLDSGPFYHRMLARFEVTEASGKTFSGVGITEYLKPSRLHIGFFRPFVQFRMRRKG